MLRAIHRLILAGAAFALPLSASAHGSEFLVGKVIVQTDGRVLLEVTADYGDNPMIANEDEAAAAVRSSLRPAGDVATLGEPRLEKRSQPDPDSPLPPDPMMTGKPHQLLTAVWQFTPNSRDVRFEVPQGAGQTVVLWTKNLRQPGEDPRWVMLVPGEQSPAIQIPPQATRTTLWIFSGFAGLTLIAGFSLQAVIRRGKGKARAARDQYSLASR